MDLLFVDVLCFLEVFFDGDAFADLLFVVTLCFLEVFFDDDTFVDLLFAVALSFLAFLGFLTFALEVLSCL